MSGSMGKFSDIPYYLSTEYFTTVRSLLTTTPAPTANWNEVLYNTVVFSNTADFIFNSVDGFLDWTATYDSNENKPGIGRLSRRNIRVKGGEYTDAFVKIDEYGFKPIRMAPPNNNWISSNDPNLLKFEILDVVERQPTDAVRYDEISVGARHIINDCTITPTVSAEMFNGNEIYLRKDCLFNEWFITFKELQKNFVNNRKLFIYFGEAYSVANENGRWYIIYKGMKDFVEKAFPDNNMNARLKDFIWTFYDKVYQEIYNLQKNIWTLIDPEEIDIVFLGYIAKMYNIDIDNVVVSENRLREFVRFLPIFLKHKGSYASVYIIWKALSGAKQDSINIYDMWHDSTVSISPSGQFSEYNYINNYTGSTYPSAYSVPDNSILSTHYTVEINHNTRPISDSAIMDEDTMNALLYCWELTRPITRVSHYSQLISPRTDFTGTIIPLYDLLQAATWKSRCIAVTTAVSGTAILVENTPVVTSIYQHGLSSTTPIVQCYDINMNKVMPKSVIPINPMVIQIDFDTEFTGVIFCCLPELLTKIDSPSDYWNIPHMMNQKTVISQVKYSDKSAFIPEDIALIDADNLVISTENVQGYALTDKGGYVHSQLSAATQWNITHGLGYIGVMVELYDHNYKMIMPDSITLLDEDSCVATFSTPISGSAVCKTVGSPAIKANIVNAINDPSAFFRLGDGTDSTWNAKLNNNVENPIFIANINSITETDDSYIFNLSVPEGNAFAITEVGIFKADGTIMFYTFGSELYKHNNTKLNIKYIVAK